MENEEMFFKMAMEEWKNYPNIHLLGNPKAQSEHSDRLAVFSFLIYHPRSKLYLHQNFVAALLNDVFGIQVKITLYKIFTDLQKMFKIKLR